jgi:hypothetical protein
MSPLPIPESSLYSRRACVLTAVAIDGDRRESHTRTCSSTHWSFLHFGKPVAKSQDPDPVTH